ncbi:lipopolysaccharide assembly protein LapA domain-containing protein [Roseovarius sp. SCSIO 43702]|uniref:lipopolysaccharide assembly protein LapA domain-containing protein n=1 Tax=Roseovarius sp. SCSIO 43702 TaxID=2823043 RepID=UPI001C738076|nr:lipopolysaccharide assembly protein LapA domain-containing protein [Roseovarius sp. SCSIO 43702]QYX55789.1 lipopolysaccharide assembly protein LapA domain-containing protein [Roseovarius sp. SCSIO 43702]
MRYIRYACIAIFAVALILVALANRQMVAVRLIPAELNSMAAVTPAHEVPLFVVIFGGVLAGLVLGFLWEYIREAKERAAAARQAREMARLRAELRRLKGERRQNSDDVLTLLDETG